MSLVVLMTVKNKILSIRIVYGGKFMVCIMTTEAEVEAYLKTVAKH